jgi:hypothetical protein
MEPRARAESVWYRTAGLAARNRKDLAVDIIESEIRSAMREVWLEAAKLVLTETSQWRSPGTCASSLSGQSGRSKSPTFTG